MKVKMYDNAGKASGNIELSEKTFGTDWNPDLMHFIAQAQLSNTRQVSAHAKMRGEVSGGGKKPWAQKGTGRARHGSNRSPIWTGGGVTHGPRSDRNYTKNINKKVRRKAIFMGLAEKARQDSLIFVESLEIASGKTKDFVNMLSKLPCANQNTLVVLPAKSDDIIRAANNVPNIKTIQARELTALAIVQAKHVLMPKDSLKIIEETFKA